MIRNQSIPMIRRIAALSNATDTYMTSKFVSQYALALTGNENRRTANVATAIRCIRSNLSATYTRRSESQSMCF